MPRSAAISRLDDLKAGADLQDHGSVHDVLRGRAPMHVAAGVAALLRHLVHQRQDRIADDIGLAAQQVEIERRNIGSFGDLLGGLRRDHAAARLGLRQRNLDLGVARDQAEIGKHLAHRRRAEGVAEQDGVEDGGRGRKGGHVVSCGQFVQVSSCHNLRPLGKPITISRARSGRRVRMTMRAAAACAGTRSRRRCPRC